MGRYPSNRLDGDKVSIRNNVDRISSGKGPLIRVVLEIDPVDAQKIWNQVKHRYKHLGKTGNPLNVLIRDLLKQETGVDISGLNSRHSDPLCNKQFASDLLKSNPDTFSYKQELWIQLRGQGLSYSNIARRSKDELEKKGYRGLTPESVSQFFIRLRDNLGLARPKRIRSTTPQPVYPKPIGNWKGGKRNENSKESEAVVND